ncbi:MAG: nickel pincer cofactor biosynthesis protein LarC [Phycisphaerae bacterium]
MALIYVDAFAGAAGDMLLGALLDAGADEAALRQHLASLPVSGYDLDVREEVRHGLRATRAEVRVDAHAHHAHRGLAEVVEILDAGDLPGPAAAQAKAIFRRLAEAEAAVHGTTVEAIQFHEVGAVDAIVDIAGVVTGLALLGAERLVCSPLPMGSGYVEAAHGRLPVPAPAVVELVRGCPTAECGEGGERTTPTGAAILVTLAEAFGPMPPMVPEAVGYGAGGRTGKHVANCVRVVLGRASATIEAERDTLWLIEANLDDATGEAMAAAAEAVLAAGARDVWLAPVTMKKGRPGVVLACLADDGVRAAVEEAVFVHTPTFGLRRRRVERSLLTRTHVEVPTPYGPVRIKVGSRAGGVVTASPEYEDCLRAAEQGGVAVRTVLDAARAAWHGRAGAAGRAGEDA